MAIGLVFSKIEDPAVSCIRSNKIETTTATTATTTTTTTTTMTMTYGLSFELNSVCQWVVTEEMMVKGGGKEKSIEYKRRLDLWMSLLLPSVALLQFLEEK